MLRSAWNEVLNLSFEKDVPALAETGESVTISPVAMALMTAVFVLAPTPHSSQIPILLLILATLIPLGGVPVAVCHLSIPPTPYQRLLKCPLRHLPKLRIRLTSIRLSLQPHQLTNHLPRSFHSSSSIARIFPASRILWQLLRLLGQVQWQSQPTNRPPFL